jgi:hypothetical protein
VKRESSEAGIGGGSVSPGSMYNNVLDGSAFNSRSGYLVYDNSYQGKTFLLRVVMDNSIYPGFDPSGGIVS